LYVQDELLVVKDKIVLEIVDLVKWVADDVDDDALNQLLTSHAADHAPTHGSLYCAARKSAENSTKIFSSLLLLISTMMRLLLDVSNCFCPTPEPLLVV